MLLNVLDSRSQETAVVTLSSECDFEAKADASIKGEYKYSISLK